MNKHVEILVIEDDKNDQEFIKIGLEKNNLVPKLQILCDGEAACEFIKNYRKEKYPILKVIFLDLKLPKVSGLEVLKKLKASKKTRSIPVVILSSSEQEADIREAYDLGVNSFLTKPLDFQKFKSVIDVSGFYWGIVNKT